MRFDNESLTQVYREHLESNIVFKVKYHPIISYLTFTLDLFIMAISVINMSVNYSVYKKVKYYI